MIFAVFLLSSYCNNADSPTVTNKGLCHFILKKSPVSQKQAPAWPIYSVFFFFFPETLPKSQHPKTDQCSLNLASVVAPTDSTSAPWILMGGCTACCVSHITALRRYKMAERNQAPSSTWWTWASPELVWTNTHLCNHSAMLKSPAVVLIWWHSNPRADWSLLSLSCLVSVLCTISLKAIRNS